jgi:hypothetical protein
MAEHSLRHARARGYRGMQFNFVVRIEARPRSQRLEHHQRIHIPVDRVPERQRQTPDRRR